MTDVAILPRAVPEYCVTCQAPLRSVIIASERRHHANYFCGHAQWFDPLPPEPEEGTGRRCDVCGEVIASIGQGRGGPRKCDSCFDRARERRKMRQAAATRKRRARLRRGHA
jgi:hypothetical protein